MNAIRKGPLGKLGYGFVDPRHLPPGADEYYLRDAGLRKDLDYRRLHAGEIEVLVKNENTADDWGNIHVTDRFSPDLVKRCQFYGLVRIGALENYYLEFHDLRMPVGLYSSCIVSSDLGCNVVVDNVRSLAHYIVGDEAILLNIDEMLTTDYAKFGNGLIKDGESEDVRIWLEICNENRGRKVLPFDGMLPGDAFLWAKHRGEPALMVRLKEMTEARFDRRRGHYGRVGARTIIKDCHILKDVTIGSDAYIKGANKLKNLTIHSDEKEGSQIGEGVELVNGIIGHGCRIFYGVKAVRFILGSNSSLKYGARLINSILGDNSTISCCEALNSLIYPSHEQHHNNSFLTAALLLGQSNMAAGATIGSNHNSRANDGELIAGRGFWPGLCVSVKHNSRFASFTLLGQGAYTAELDVRLPFSLVANDPAEDRLIIRPGFWFLHNMYALQRNALKFRQRDTRIHKGQSLEFHYLAPDTADEMAEAIGLIEEWAGRDRAGRRGTGPGDDSMDRLREAGRELLEQGSLGVEDLVPWGAKIERSTRPVSIRKAADGWAAYREMLEFYCVRAIVEWMKAEGIEDLSVLPTRLGAGPRVGWVNVGGQLMTLEDVNRLKRRILAREIDSWDEVHEEYHRLAERYRADKARHAWALLGGSAEGRDAWTGRLDRAASTARKIARLTRDSREKDYQGYFRTMTYDSPEEMEAVMGALSANEVVVHAEREAAAWISDFERLKSSEAALR